MVCRPHSHRIATDPAPSRRRVIIADDHSAVRSVLKRLLDPICNVVSMAIDGEDLLQQVDEVIPDVVVSDAFMPRMNGLDACRHIRRIHPAVRVVIVSVALDEHVVESAFAAGAHAVVRKIDIAEQLPAAVLANA